MGAISNMATIIARNGATLNNSLSAPSGVNPSFTNNFNVSAKDWKIIPFENLIAEMHTHDTELIAEVENVKEAELMMYNLIPYFLYKYGEQSKLYFSSEALEDAKEDGQDKETKRVIYITDEFIEEDFEDDIGLEGAQSFIEANKK